MTGRTLHTLQVLSSEIDLAESDGNQKAFITVRGGADSLMEFFINLRASPFKGTVSRDFLLLVFFMNQFPPVPEYLIRTVSDFFENSQRYSQVKVHHRYQLHWRLTLPPVSLVLLIPVVNQPPCQQYRRQTVAICHRYQ